MALLYPVLAQVLFTFAMILAAGRARIRAAKAGRVRIGDIALSAEAWPADIRKIGNNMNNQFQTPVLFYVLCGIALFIGAAGPVMVALGWLFVATRLVHAYIHVTTNDVVRRLQAFVAGFATLVVMWIMIVAHLLSA